MTADCADYEVYRSGKYVPGLMGTLFSLSLIHISMEMTAITVKMADIMAVIIQNSWKNWVEV